MDSQPTKSPLLSKTLWVNAVVALCALLYPPAADWIQANGASVALIMSGVNMLLRLVTKEKLELYSA